MRILVDESLPRRFARELSAFDVSTVRDEGWAGLKNGVLLRAAAQRGFTVLLTADRSLEFQQNLTAVGMAVLILGGRNRMSDLRLLVPQVIDVVTAMAPGQVVRLSA